MAVNSNRTKFLLRPYHPKDARQAVDVVNANALQSLGVRQAVVDGSGNVRLARYVSMESEKVVATDERNDVIGYAYCSNLDRSIVHEFGGAVHPDYWGLGVGSKLLGWAEQRAAAKAKHAPPDVRIVLQGNLFEVEREAIRLFAESGFQKVRDWAHLAVDLVAPPPAPDLPGELSIRQMDLDDDWDLVGSAMDDAFANHWGWIPPSFTAVEEQPDREDLPEDETYSNAPGYCFIAMAGKEAAGGVLCNARLVEREDTGRIGSLFVRLRYQRQGVGKALILAAFGAFWKKGIKRIITDTDADSFTQAPKFYTSLGMQLYRREYLYEKEIRAGKEVRRLSQ
jgi:GNAT superfamily N-acetyltransferase